MSSIEIESLKNACFSGNESTVRNMLSENNFNDYLASSSGYSLLCSMLKNSIYFPQRYDELQAEDDDMNEQNLNYLEISKLLLQHPVKVNEETQDHDQTPLHFAVQTGNVEIVKILLEKGAIVNATNNELNTPLHIAVSGENCLSESVIQLLLENGADIKICNKFYNTPYHESFNKSIGRILSQHEVKMLLDSDGNIEETDSIGYTALHRAVECESYDLVEFLVSRGSDVNVETNYDGTPLHLASRIHHKEISALLLRAGADVNATDTYSDDTPLHFAARHLSVVDSGKFLQMLINNGADSTATNYYGLIPLNFAVESLSLNGATILLGENPNTSDMTLKMAFCLSFLCSYYQTLPYLRIFKNRDSNYKSKLISELFYYHGFRLNIEDIKNMPIPEKLLVSLDHSTLMEHRHIVQSLLNKEETTCVEKMRQEFLEYHVLIGAIKYGFIDIFYNFIQNVRDVNIALIDGLTLLHHACEGGRSTIVNELLARGANVNVIGGRYKFSPLHVSVKYNWVEITKILLTKNADINSQGKKNKTPLCVGVSRKSFKCIQLLLQAGADVNCISFNQTLLFYAIALNINVDITKLLLHYGATCVPGEMDPIFEYLSSQSEFNEMIDLASDHSVNIRDLDRNYPKFPNELEEMKKTKISDTDVTMYDLLTMSHRRLSILLRNDNFVDFLNSFDFKTSFPNFARRFEVRVNKAKLEKRLIELSYDCFRTIVKFKLPILVLNEIVSYIDTADLHRFVIASPLKWEMKKTVQFHCSE